MIIGLALGVVASLWVGIAARDEKLAAYLPNPWLTACLGLGIVALGWVMANAAPRFAAALAGAALPGAVYAAVTLAGDDTRQLAYGWSAIPVALACLALGAGLHASRHASRPWSARRSTAPRIPRARTH